MNIAVSLTADALIYNGWERTSTKKQASGLHYGHNHNTRHTLGVTSGSPQLDTLQWPDTT